ncbi:5-formyltetrahydrofolate cyclo-ligase [Geofilum rubicundum]|nr:5-formyltetrahydrofolate cyclo-ligase [Geofilum rubicundum]
MEMIQKKKALRKHITYLKSVVPLLQMQEESRHVVAAIEALAVFKQARTVLAYWPMFKELDLSSLLNKWQAEKVFLLPVVQGDSLEIRRFQGETSLAPGPSFGIMEPVGPAFNAFGDIDLVLVPGVAFDEEGRRIGHGKAYYDRLLPQLTKAFKIGVGFSFQLVEDVPSEAHDVRLDLVVVPPMKPKDIGK